jgi:hypothetical protein
VLGFMPPRPVVWILNIGHTVIFSLNIWAQES